MLNVMRISEGDNLIVALSDIKAGQTIDTPVGPVKVIEDVPAKHKFTACNIELGGTLSMYGITIGKAIAPLQKGQRISTNNVQHSVSPYEVRASQYRWKKPDVSRWINKTFDGYHRADGQVGTRNYWLVVPLVFCENRNIEFIKNAFIKKLGYGTPDKYEALVDNLIRSYQTGRSSEDTSWKKDKSENDRLFKNIDGIKFLTHQGGCGGTRDDSNALAKLIAGYINNPNVAGATILSLGCQNLQIDHLRNEIENNNRQFKKPLLFFEQQKSPGEQAMLEQAIRETFQRLTEANSIERKPAPLSKLTVGLKCGGSDGFSGITANPAMGHVSDMLVELGATTILAEFPELCGIEQELIDRTEDIEKAKKFATLMYEYNKRAESIGSGFSMNPSPGNIKDGLITDAMKSAGAAKKGGTAPIVDVLNYAEYKKKNGLNLLCTPGNDVEATTGMAGSGATLIIFSTGLGTPTGNPIAPVIKTATNTILAEKLSDLIDFDHGDIITHGVTVDESAEKLMELLVKMASGKLTKAELLHQDDFIPWKRGVSL